jgi:hypothetical protein
MITSRSFLFKKRNLSGRSCRENQNTHFMSDNFSPENRAFHEIMWKNIVEPEKQQMTIWHGAGALHAV